MDIFIHIAHAATEAVAGNPEAQQTGVVALFGLNWKLFLAQLINFGIILFVLWKWVFRPVAKGLADRTTKIEGSLAEAERIAGERETFDSWKNKEISEVRQEAANIITEAKAGAERARTEITQTAMEESKKILERGKAQLEAEKNKAVQEIKLEVADMVVQTTETILKKKLDSASDKALIKDALAALGAKK
jgi:F-type H+-transporting ATPase subunit b